MMIFFPEQLHNEASAHSVKLKYKPVAQNRMHDTFFYHLTSFPSKKPVV